MLVILVLLLNLPIVCVTRVFLVTFPCEHPRIHTPNTKAHPRWCIFVFGIVPLPYNTRRARNHTHVDVISCSALFLRPTAHADHKKTPSLVSFRVRRCSFAVQHTSVLRPTAHAEHETPSLVWFRVRRHHAVLPLTLNTKGRPRWHLLVFGILPLPCQRMPSTLVGVFFVFGVFSPSYHTRRARQYTLVGSPGYFQLFYILLNTYYIH